jgi:FtsZ-interacting cell division protein ZipA
MIIIIIIIIINLLLNKIYRVESELRAQSSEPKARSQSQSSEPKARSYMLPLKFAIFLLSTTLPFFLLSYPQGR